MSSNEKQAALASQATQQQSDRVATQGSILP